LEWKSPAVSWEIPLEVLPEETQRNEHHNSEVLPHLALVSNALIDSPPITHRGYETEWNNNHEKRAVAIESARTDYAREEYELHHRSNEDGY
jgi:hypothetical protein